MRLEDTAQFLRTHVVAFPISEEDAALLAIALHALAVVAKGNPHVVLNLIAGVTHFLQPMRKGA